MTVMRALTEGNRGCLSALHFNKLTDAGISPEFAFILGHYLDTNMSSISARYDSHHCALPKDQMKDRKSTRELQSLMSISYAVFCLKQKKNKKNNKFNNTL